MDEIFYHFCRQVFLSLHEVIIVIIELGGLREVNMWEVWENVPKMLDHLGTFKCSLYLLLAETEAGDRFLDFFPDDSLPT